MNFNKQGFDAFRADFQEAVKSVEEKHGVKIDIGGIRYRAYDFTTTMTVTKSDSGVDGKKEIFEQQCVSYGFSKDDYEREFTLDKKRFKLIGFNPKSPKNCCSIHCITDGNTYKCSAETVRRAFLVEK